jgi:hypothetical protein
MAHSYRFDERMAMSCGTATEDDIGTLLVTLLVGATRAERATEQDDRNGTDWWVYRECGKRLSIDVKVRQTDWAAAHPNEDDLALESWSVLERHRPGWTRDANKRTDYVLWFWQDTRRFSLLPFPMLLAVFSESWEAWAELYRVAQQYTPDSGYHSECVFVPRRVVWRAIYERFA